MSKIVSINTSDYLNATIDQYTKNKVGQYSKYLDKSHSFVTYLPINQVMSRTDVGLGGIEHDGGNSSALRFNQINHLPVWNLPELKPDLEYDETGADISLDISDIVIPPGTVKPCGGDYMIVTLPNSHQCLFRATSFRYNTIQSNDFYFVDFELKCIGQDVLQTYFSSSQIIDVFETVFENIGTEDKCFVRLNDIPKINAIASYYDELKSIYRDMYYNKTYGCFVYSLPSLQPTLYCDNYLEKFINETEIFIDDKYPIYLTQNSTPQVMEESLYKQSLLYAVITRNTDYLLRHMYMNYQVITKTLSVFNIYHVLALSSCLIPSSTERNTDENYYSYYDQGLIDALKGFIPDTTEGQQLTEYVTDNYILELIYKFVNNQSISIDKLRIIPYSMEHGLFGYKYIPIIIYILSQYYKTYFEKLD